MELFSVDGAETFGYFYEKNNLILTLFIIKKFNFMRIIAINVKSNLFF